MCSRAESNARSNVHTDLAKTNIEQLRIGMGGGVLSAGCSAVQQIKEARTTFASVRTGTPLRLEIIYSL